VFIYKAKKFRNIIIINLFIIITFFFLPILIARPTFLCRLHFVTHVTEEFISIYRNGNMFLRVFWNVFHGRDCYNHRKVGLFQIQM